MLCIYKDTLDSRCAASLVVAEYERNGWAYDPKRFIIYNAKTFHNVRVRKREQVFIVGETIPAQRFDFFLQDSDSVIWIDRLSNGDMKDYSNFSKVNGVRSTTFPASILAWSYFNKMARSLTYEFRKFSPIMADDAPAHIKFISDYVSGAREGGERARKFIDGLLVKDTSPTSRVWSALHNTNTSAEQTELTVLDGENIALSIARHAKHAYGTIFEGVKCYVLNFGELNMDYLEKIVPKEYEVIMTYVFDGEKNIVNIRSRGGIDVGTISRVYGGYGNERDARFECQWLPFS